MAKEDPRSKEAEDMLVELRRGRKRTMIAGCFLDAKKLAYDGTICRVADSSVAILIATARPSSEMNRSRPTAREAGSMIIDISLPAAVDAATIPAMNTGMMTIPPCWHRSMRAADQAAPPGCP